MYAFRPAAKLREPVRSAETTYLHRPKSTMGAPEVRSFLGGRSQGDRCLYVSTGGFSKGARYEADRSNIPIRLLTLVDLRRLLVDNYEDVDEEVRTLVPLRKVYVVAD